MSEPLQRLDDGQGVEPTSGLKNPLSGAGTSNRSHAIRAKKLVVAEVDYNQVGLVLEGFSQDAEHRKARNGGRAEINDLDLALTPGVLEHQLQKGRRAEMPRFGISLHCRFTQKEDSNVIGRFRVDEGILFTCASAVRISEKPGSSAALCREHQIAARDRTELSKHWSVAAQPTESERQLNHADKQQRQERGEQPKCKTLTRG